MVISIPLSSFGSYFGRNAQYSDVVQNNENSDSNGENNNDKNNELTHLSTKTYNAVPPSPYIAASPHWILSVNNGTSDDEDVPSTTENSKQHNYGHNNQDKFSPFIAFCFTMNYIVGTGFLTIPWAFVQSGIVLSTIVMIITSIFSDIAKDYLLETMARAEVMLDNNMHWINNRNDKKDKKIAMKSTTIHEHYHDDSEINLLTANQYKNELNKYYDSFTSTAPSTPTSSEPGTPNNNDHYNERHRLRLKNTESHYMIRDRKFEVNTLCRVYLGKRGLHVFVIFLSMYLYGTLCAYTNVFASAMSRTFPIFDHEDNYIVYAMLFAIFVIPMSCLELHEQIKVQVFLTLCRFLMLLLMITTSYQCSSSTKNEFDFNRKDQDDDSSSSTAASDFQPSGLLKTLPILAMASLYHLAIPGLSHPVKDKTKLGNVIFRSTTVITAVMYIALGIILALTFGTNIEQSANLNWKTCHYTNYGIDDDSYGKNVQPWWWNLISFYIILFPAIDVLSAFPLNAITLGNNMFGAFYGSTIHEVENNRCLRSCFRLLASIPPIIFSIFVRELGVITDYTGTAGFIIGLTIPSLLYMESKKMAIRKHFGIMTYYTSYGSNSSFAKLLAWFGISMVFLVFVSAILGKL